MSEDARFQQAPFDIDVEALRGKSLLIATPTYNNMLCVPYVNSLIATVDMCRQLGIKLVMGAYSNIAAVPRMRNYCALQFMAGAYDFMLFIDSDISWQAGDVLRLMQQDKEVIGVPPRKNLHAEDQSPFGVNLWPGAMSVDMGAAEVREIATAFLMLKQSLFTKLRNRFPHFKYHDPDVPGGMEYNYAFFNYGIQEDFDGCPRLKGEDYYFMDLVREIGVPIHMDVDVSLGHHKTVPLEGKFLDYIKQKFDTGDIQ